MSSSVQPPAPPGCCSHSLEQLHPQSCTSTASAGDTRLSLDSSLSTAALPCALAPESCAQAEPSLGRALCPPERCWSCVPMALACPLGAPLLPAWAEPACPWLAVCSQVTGWPGSLISLMGACGTDGASGSEGPLLASQQGQIKVWLVQRNHPGVAIPGGKRAGSCGPGPCSGMAVPLCQTVTSVCAWGCCTPSSSPASLRLCLSHWDYLPLLLLQLLPGIPNPQNAVSPIILVIKSGS